MCVKNFPLEVFWCYLFFKKGSKTKQSHTIAQPSNALCALKTFSMKVFAELFSKSDPKKVARKPKIRLKKISKNPCTVKVL